MSIITVALAEDHHEFRKSVIRFLKTEKAIDVIIEARNGSDLLCQLERIEPDVILMDIRMPEMDGVETTKIVRQRYPHIKIIAFTQFDLADNIIRMSKLGVKCFLGKDKAEAIPQAIKIVNDGWVYFPAEIAEILQGHLSIGPVENVVPVNEFELNLLRSICIGMSSTEIGLNLHKSPRTIEEHRVNLYKKFKVPNKEQLIVEACRQGLI